MLVIKARPVQVEVCYKSVSVEELMGDAFG